MGRQKYSFEFKNKLLVIILTAKEDIDILKANTMYLIKN